MLTKDQIRKQLLENPDWEPEGELTHEEWEIFDEVYDEMDTAGELKKKTVVKSEEDDWDTDDEEENDEDDDGGGWDD